MAIDPPSLPERNSKSPKVGMTAVKQKSNAPTTAAKRKRKMVVDLTFDDEAELEPQSPKKKAQASKKKPDDGEKRLKRYRQHASASYLEKLNRATTQR